MTRHALVATLMTALAIPGAASAQCALHGDHEAPHLRQESREIDRGDETQDLMDIARKEKKNALKVFFDAYRRLEWETGNAYQIDAKTLDVSWGTLTLSGGIIIPLRPEDIDPDLLAEKGEDWVPDREYIMAVYIGDGSFTWEPPNETEKWALNNGLREVKALGKKDELDELNATIDGGAVIHLNGKWRELLEEGSKQVTADAKTLKEAKKLFSARADLDGIDWARKHARDAFEGEERGFLGLEMATKSIKQAPYLTYQYDPDEHEAAAVGIQKRYALNRDVVNGWSLGQWVDEAVAEGKSTAELAKMATTWEVDISHYTQDMTVSRDDDEGAWGMAVEGTADVTFNQDRKTLRLAMMSRGENGRRVSVKTLKDGEGNVLPFLHHGNELIAVLPKKYAAGETMKLQYAYEGNFILTIKQEKADVGVADQNANAYVNIINYRVPNDYPWFPQVPDHVDGYTFDWTLRLPKPMVAATSGMLMSLVEEGKFNVHTIKETVPVTFPAILFGRFAMRENTPDFDKGEVKIRVFVHPGYEKDIDSFIDEAQSILSYYSAVFGPYPYKELDLAQMPGFFGYAQAPAGLVQMTGEVYMSKTDLANLYSRTDNLRDYFIPHEIGHEWWGHRAGWGSYRDQWVSETFAEYSAALYVEERDRRKKGDPNDTSGYDDRSIEWKRARKGHVQSRTGPLWLGYRNPHYTSTVYARGPLILDQLRKQFGREAVLKVMYAYNNLAHENGGHAITDDFKLVLEQVIPGVGFDQFIDQFVKLNGAIPND